VGDGKLIIISMTGNRHLIEDVDFVDSVGMFATTRQTTVDVRSVSPVLTSGTHFLSISGKQHQ